MAGIMNSYFYGKAGQADYTVDQLPTNRKQLFFTTLKVRFSSMMGLNFLHVLWILPLAIWIFVAAQTALMFVDDSAIPNLGNENLARSYSEYSVLQTEINAIASAERDIEKLNYELETIRHNIGLVSEGKDVMVEEPAVVEGGEPTLRPVTMDELMAQEAEMLAKITEAENFLARGEDDDYMSELRANLNEKYIVFGNERRAALQGNIIMSLLIMIPLMGLAGVGHTGQAYVLRNWARDEHSFMLEDYKNAIKANWKQGLIVGLLNGLSFIICFMAYVTYGEMAASSGWFYTVPQMLMVILLIVWWMMNEIIFFMMVTYDMKIRVLIRNSLLMVISRLPIAFVILLGSVAVPVLILLLVPYVQFSILALIVIYGVIGFSLVGFIQASFANSCFDLYLNPRIEGAKVNQGLHVEEDDDEAEEDIKVEQKEDRYWEHKTE